MEKSVYNHIYKYKMYRYISKFYSHYLYHNFTVIIHRLCTSKFARLIKSVNNPQIDTRDVVTHIEKEKRPDWEWGFGDVLEQSPWEPERSLDPRRDCKGRWRGWLS